MTIHQIIFIFLFFGMYAIEVSCQQPEDSGMQRIAIIVPGTKWCGPGNNSEDNNSLGKFNNTDACCRTHDRCDDLIEAGQKKCGLENDSWFTKLNCKCDLEFHRCLHAVDSTVSNIIGREYFTFETECYEKAHPIIKCLEYDRFIIWKRCEKYKYNTTEPEKCQWVDLPWYNSDKSKEQQATRSIANRNVDLTPEEYFKEMENDRKLLGVPPNSPRVRTIVRGVW